MRARFYLYLIRSKRVAPPPPKMRIFKKFPSCVIKKDSFDAPGGCAEVVAEHVNARFFSLAEFFRVCFFFFRDIEEDDPHGCY